MKIKVSDLLANTLARMGITQVFTVTGGGAMHLNDSLGHCPELSCLYHHHEQAAAMAAEAYARVDNRVAAVCVTTGPGATNAITGALCGWMDSIPMLVISGQVRRDITVRNSGLKIRTMGVQEYDVIPTVEHMTKYAVMVTKPEEIVYHVERAVYRAKHGRPGPAWLDIPLDVQSAVVDTEQLRAYDCSEDADLLPEEPSAALIGQILEKLREAKRPLIYAGHGIRLAGAYTEFRRLVDLLGIPVVTGMSSIDLMESDHPLYVGRTGGTGDRAGNYAVQNSDVYLCLGSRQGILQTGFNFTKWAPNAYTIINDIDGEELKKKSLHVSLPVQADAKALIEGMLKQITAACSSEEMPYAAKIDDWRLRCAQWKKRYPVVTAKHYEELEPGRTNIYAFYEKLSEELQEGAQILVSVGTARVAGSQSIRLKKNQRFYTNAVTASMGYGLPGAIGVCIGSNGGEVVCVNGEGCMQMNIQELQTIRHHQLPIRIFVINNEGYHSIRWTQTSYFHGNLVGVGEESGDLSFPDLSLLAPAYGIAYKQIRNSSTLKEDIRSVLEGESPCICEVFVSKLQKTEPKLASRQLPDGTMVSASLEDMFPFLPREEQEENMRMEDDV